MTTTTSRFRSDVQGMRAVAVLLVMLYHAGVPGIEGGYVGVDVFFVISGFLITSQLLTAIERDGHIRFGEFYARRARRILPAALVVAAVTALAVILVYPVRLVAGALRDALATVLYVPNVWFAVQDTDYLADHDASPFQHFWSLGVEEQFYLLWPLALVAVLWVMRGRRARAVAVLAVMAAISFVAGVLLTTWSPSFAFFLLPTRAWELMVGGLVAFAMPFLQARLPSALAATLGWAGLAGIIVAALVFDADVAFPGWAATLPVVGAALVILAGAGSPRGGPTALLSVRPAQHIGALSYALYLVHWPLLVVPEGARGFAAPLPLWATLLLGLPVAYGAAVLLHRFVEEPARTAEVLRRRRPAVTLGWTGVVSLALCTSLVAVTAWADARPTPTGGPVAAVTQATDPPDGTAFVPANMDPDLESASEDLPVVYADDCQHNQQEESLQDCHYGSDDANAVTIAVFGDSHSAQWFPAMRTLLDLRDDVRLDAYTKSFCPAVEVTPVLKGQTYDSCVRWRDRVVRELVEHPVDLVVISSSAFYTLDGAADPAERQRLWRAGTADIVSRLASVGTKVLVIADTPRLAQPPVGCLSATPLDADNCANERADALDPDLAAIEADTVRAHGGSTLDLTDYLCDATTCPAIIDNVLVYRDINHLTATMAKHLAPEVRAAVVPLIDDILRER